MAVLTPEVTVRIQYSGFFEKNTYLLAVEKILSIRDREWPILKTN